MMIETKLDFVPVCNNFSFFFSREVMDKHGKKTNKPKKKRKFH